MAKTLLLQASSLSLIFSASSLAVVNSPSFDCKKAKTKVERAICGSPKLAQADLELAAVFKGEADKAEQKAWLKSRDTCTKRPASELNACLEKSYHYRLRQIVFSQLRERPNEEVVARAEKAYVYLEKVLGENLACDYLKDDSEHAIRDLSAYHGSSLDGMFPMCGNVALPKPVQAFVEQAERMRGDLNECQGTMRFMYGRNEALALAVAALVPNPPDSYTQRQSINRLRSQDLEGKFSYLEGGSGPSLRYYPDLQHWSEQGIYERELYKEYKKREVEAEAALSSYYQSDFKLKKADADRYAKMQIELIEDAFLGHSGSSSTLSYASLCYESQDVENFLKTGTVVDKECPYKDFAESSKGSILRRLLGIAIVTGRSEKDIAKIIDAGADLEPSSKFDSELKDSPLMMAADRTEVIRLLIKAGASVKHKGSLDKTPLIHAVQAKNLSGVQELLKAGANVNAVTTEDHECGVLAGKRSVLMYAAWQGTEAIIDELLKKDADRKLKDTEGKTARDYLTQNTQLSPEVKKKLEKRLSI